MEISQLSDGKHMLLGIGHDTRDMWIGDDVDMNIFNIDGTLFAAYINPADGWRSYGDFVKLQEDVEMLMFQEPQPIIVKNVVVDGSDEDGFYVRKEVVVITDEKSGKEILHVGTDLSDSYYPSALWKYDPNIMANVPVEKNVVKTKLYNIRCLMNGHGFLGHLPLPENKKVYAYRTWEEKNDMTYGIYLIPFTHSPHMDEYLGEIGENNFVRIQNYSENEGLIVLRDVSFDSSMVKPDITNDFSDFPKIELYKRCFDDDKCLHRVARMLGPDSECKSFVQTWIDLDEPMVSQQIHMFEIEHDILDTFLWDDTNPRVDTKNQEYNRKVFHTVLAKTLDKYGLNTYYVDCRLGNRL